MTSSSFESSKVLPPSSKVLPPPCESTPLGGVSLGGPVSQDKKKKKSSRSVFQVVMLLLVCLGFTVFSRRSSLASSSSVVDQSILKSENKVEYENDRSNDVSPTASLTEVINTNENDNVVFPMASLVESETKSSLPPTITLRFPDGIYDASMNGDPTKLLKITNACHQYVTENKKNSANPTFMAKILACHIYQNGFTPIVLGTLTYGANVLQLATDMADINSSRVSSLFVDHAFAAMIDRGCFVWNNQRNRLDYALTQTNDYSEYMSESSTVTGQSVDTSASYFGVTASAGYEQFNRDQSGGGETTETAYGQRQYFAEVGRLDNVCFDTQSRFDKLIKDLVKPQWVKCWNTIRRNGRRANIKDLRDTACFSKVADGGFYMPMQYDYRVGTKITLRTTYSSSSTQQSSAASSAITAGLSATTGDFDGSVSSAISKAVEKSTKSNNYSSTVHQSSTGFGYQVGISCLEAGDCPRVVRASVKAIRKDFSHLGPPSSLGLEYKSLDQIMKLYFGDYGLPDNFLAAVDFDYIEYKNYAGIGGNDLGKCGRFGSKKAIEDYCNSNHACMGYSYDKNQWWCAKTTSAPGNFESNAVWYQKPYGYIERHGYTGIGGNDLGKCGRFGSRKAIEDYCNSNDACKGYSYTRKNGWWCAKTTSAKGNYERDAVWYQKPPALL